MTHLSCTSCGLHHENGPYSRISLLHGLPETALSDLRSGRGWACADTRLRWPAREIVRRYHEVLPLPAEVEPISLGEGGTPLLRAARFGGGVGVTDLWIKDEARKIRRRVSKRAAWPSRLHGGAPWRHKAGRSPGRKSARALAAYAVRAGLRAHIFMPRDTPRANIIECRELRSERRVIDGLITDCSAGDRAAENGRRLVRHVHAQGTVSSRGQKTLGYELAEQLGTGLTRRHPAHPTGGQPALSACGKRSTRWKPSAGLVRRDRACSPCKPAAALDHCAPSKRERRPRPNSPMLTPALPVCASPKAVGDFLMLRSRIQGRRGVGG